MGYGELGLVLRRRKGQRVVIGDGDDAVIVTVVATGRDGGSVVLAFDAPDEVVIMREELVGRESE
jgi:sRNA-binding carbon storage regulator CsrA